MKNLLFSIFLLAGYCATAQSNAIGENDPAAKKVLDGVSAKFKSFKSVTAKFNLKIENSTGTVQGSKTGTINMKGTKYRISVTGQEIFCDGTNIWTYDKASNEVQLTKFDGSTSTITPQKMFTNFYDKDFLYKLNDESKSGGKTLQEIELTPLDKTKTFFKVLVKIDKKAKTISSSKIFEKNGNRYTYSVNSMKTNANIPDELFAFDSTKYPNVEVVDLR